MEKNAHADEHAKVEREDCKIEALAEGHVRGLVARLTPGHRAHEGEEGRTRLRGRVR